MSNSIELNMAMEERSFSPTVSSLFTTTHPGALARRFGILIGLFFVVGLFAAMLMRIELVSPTGWLVKPDTFHKLFSLHGMMMVYFVLLPAFPAVLGLGRLPALLGTRDFAFPRLNRAAWYLFASGGLLTLLATLTGGSDAGWSFAAPYSLVSAQGAISMAAFGVLLAGLCLLLLAINIVATIHLRPQRNTRFTDLPMLAVGLGTGALTILVAAPALCAAMALVMINRLLPFQMFDATQGGDPGIFNQLFWIFATPAFYAIILPAAGAISDIIPHYARRPLTQRRWVAHAMIVAAVLSLFLWGQHLLTSEVAPVRSGLSVIFSHLIAAPFIVIILSWLLTVGRGAVSFAAPYLFALVFLLLMIAGGMTGLFLASPTLNPHLHNTVFVVAHFHFLLVGGALSALLASLLHWWPELTKRPAPEISARVAAVLLLVGVPLTFGPLFLLGYQGLPRREYAYPPELQILQVLATAGATILITGLVIAGLGLLGSVFRRRQNT